jgi:hypothetical protein
VLMPPQFRAQLPNALLCMRFAHLAHGQDYRVPHAISSMDKPLTC